MNANDKFDRPDLVVGYMKQSRRDKARPYIIGFAVVAIMVLVAIKECM